MSLKQKKEVQLIIKKEDIMIKQYNALKIPQDRSLHRLSFETSWPIQSASARDKDKKNIPVRIIEKRKLSQVIIDFSGRPIRGVYSYILNILVNPSVIERFGSLNILNYPKQDLSAIYLLKGAKDLFFTSALGRIQKNNRLNAIIIKPIEYMKGLESHANNSSAIRIEWGAPPRIRLTFTYTIENPTNNPATEIKIKTAIPNNTQFQRVRFTPKLSYEQDEDRNQYALLDIGEISAKQTKKNQTFVDVIAKRNPENQISDMGTFESLNELTRRSSIGARYLRSSKYFNIQDDSIKQFLGLLKKSSNNLTEYIKLAFEFINQKLEYQVNKIRDDAANTLRLRRGDCSEFTDLFVTLCRGGGIPAKVVHGLIIETRTKSIEPHAWAEYFTPRFGWIQCDPTWGFISGVSCQHITRRFEGIELDDRDFEISYRGEGELKVNESIHYHFL
jgi:transglutaminase-like putative cysteine protease